MPQPQILNDSQNGNPLSTGSEDGGWKRVETEGNGIGPSRGEAVPKSVSNLPRPRILTQRKKFQNTTPINLHRKWITRQEWPEAGVYPVYDQMSNSWSQGAGQYYYAPNEGNLTKNEVAWSAGLVLAEVARDGGESAIPDDNYSDRELWSDSDLNVELGPDGYLPFPGDSNFERRPDRWRFPHRDKDVSMLPENNQTSSPQPPDIFDVGNESMFYPIQGAAARLPKLPNFSEEYRFGKPELLGADPQGKNEALVQVPVWFFNHGDRPQGLPKMHVRFWLEANPKDPVHAIIHTAYPPEAYLYPAGKDAFPDPKRLISTKDYPKIQTILNAIPRDVLEAAAKEMGLTYSPKGKAAQQGAAPAQGEAIPGAAPADMTEQERLFTGIENWHDDYQALSGDEIPKEAQEVLKKKPSGSGKYFEWLYTPKTAMGPVVTVTRKPAGEKLQAVA
jgi:hypothetical protein